MFGLFEVVGVVEGDINGEDEGGVVVEVEGSWLLGKFVVELALGLNDRRRSSILSSWIFARAVACGRDIG